MKFKIKYILLYSLLLLIFLVGCSEDNKEAYSVAISNGMEELRNENYEKAAEYFKIAFEEEPEDEKAETLLSQTENFVMALDFFEKEQYEEASKKGMLVHSLENGSTFLEFKTNELMNQIQAIQDETSEEEEIFEEIKGAYATFSMERYEWPIDSLFIIGDDFIVKGSWETGLYYREIISKSFDDNKLIINTYTEEKSSNKNEQFIINLSYSQDNERAIHLETDELFYAVTVDDVLETGFPLSNNTFDVLEDLRVYDERVTQTVSYTNTSLLKDYSPKYIEYARVWLNVIGNQGVTELNISEEKEGTIINYFDDNSPVYPTDVKVITGSATADGMVIYSGNGDGTIDIYPVPSHWHAPPEDLPALYEDILNPTTMYLEPMLDEQVIRLIKRINSDS